MPLTGLRVVEVMGGVPTAYCTRLFADLGAEVLVTGPARRLELDPSADDPLARGLWRSLQRNKRLLRDAAPGGGPDWQQLLETSDVVVVEGSAEEVRTLGLVDDLPPHLVVVAITPFGLEGTRSDWLGSDLIAAAYGGGCNANGERGRPPLRPPAFVGDHEVGLNAAAAALIAVLARDRDGRGQLVDVSAVDTWATIQTGVGILEFVFLGLTEQRHGRSFAGRGYPYTTLPCKDGTVRFICIQGREWARAIEMMGSPDWARDPRYADRLTNQQRYAAELDEHVGAWLKERTTDEVLAAALEHGVPCAPVRRLHELLEDEQLASRAFFWRDGSTLLPGFPAKLEGTPARFRSAAPTPDSAVGVSELEPPATRRPAPPALDSRLPLDGVRIVDFGWAWAGAVPGAALADFGADVVKVESRRRLDPMRRDRPLVGDSWDPEQGALHHNVNRNKRSIELDLHEEDALRVLLELVAASDIFIENLSTGALAKHGLDYASLAKINPSLIYISIAAVGRTGPLASIRSYAPILTGLSGIDASVGYEGEPFLGLQHGFADPNAGLHAVVAVLAALRARGRTGRGQHIDLSQVESLVSMLGGPLVALQEGDDVSAPAGNRDRFSAPHGLYPTRGSDEWVAIACPDDDAWRRLRQLLGDPEWARSTTLDTLAGRLASASSLDERIACWTRSRDRWEIAELLQSRSIPAAPVLTSGERLVDEHLTSRDVLAVVEHPVVGSELIYGVPWKLRRTPGRVRSAAPLLGADTEAVLEEIGAIPRAGSPVAEAEWRRTG